MNFVASSLQDGTLLGQIFKEVKILFGKNHQHQTPKGKPLQKPLINHPTSPHSMVNYLLICVSLLAVNAFVPAPTTFRSISSSNSPSTQLWDGKSNVSLVSYSPPTPHTPHTTFPTLTHVKFLFPPHDRYIIIPDHPRPYQDCEEHEENHHGNEAGCGRQGPKGSGCSDADPPVL